MMTDQELATRLVDMIAPDNGLLRGLANSSDAVGAVIDLIAMAAQRRVSVPREMLDAVRDLADDTTGVADEEVAALRHDLATLAPLALTG